MEKETNATSQEVFRPLALMYDDHRLNLELTVASHISLTVSPDEYRAGLVEALTVYGQKSRDEGDAQKTFELLRRMLKNEAQAWSWPDRAFVKTVKALAHPFISMDSPTYGQNVGIGVFLAIVTCSGHLHCSPTKTQEGSSMCDEIFELLSQLAHSALHAYRESMPIRGKTMAMADISPRDLSHRLGGDINNAIQWWLSEVRGCDCEVCSLPLRYLRELRVIAAADKSPQFYKRDPSSPSRYNNITHTIMWKIAKHRVLHQPFEKLLDLALEV